MYPQVLNQYTGEVGDFTVSVIAYDDNVIRITTFFAGQEIESERIYNSFTRATSDARTIFYLLNGINNLMGY